MARYGPDADRQRVEHWTNARDMPAVAARALLADLTGTDPGAPHDRVPYVWSDQFGERVQLCGRMRAERSLEPVHGELEDTSFVAVQRAGETITAILGWNAPREFLRYRRHHEDAMTVRPQM